MLDAMATANGHPLTGVRVRLTGPRGLARDALAALLRGLGATPLTSVEERAHVALVTFDGPFPVAPPDTATPSLALLRASDDPHVVMRLGYRGYLAPHANEAALHEAISAVVAGRLWADAAVLTALLSPDEGAGLTVRERDVMQLLATGLSNATIARRLGISPSTVKAHVTALLQKHGVQSRLELVVQYYASEAFTRAPVVRGAFGRTR
jgi:DNA-binding CsgD family transcriptional regulator